MNNNWLKIEGLYKQFNGVKALDGFSCSLQQKEILGLIGPNGAGKTTFFNIITGFITPDSGQAILNRIDLVGLPPYRIASIGITRTFQELRLIRKLSVIDNVLLSFKKQPGEQLKNVFFRWKTSIKQEKKNREKALALLENMELKNMANNPAGNLSYGQQKLLSIACCFASGANILLLDEPVAGVAPAMTEKILSVIKKLPTQKKSIILIEHDMASINKVCNRVIFMEAGKKISEGTPYDVFNDPKVIETYIN